MIAPETDRLPHDPARVDTPPEPLDSIRSLFATYGSKAEEEPPLGGYAALLAVYSTAMLGALQTVRTRDCAPLEEVSVGDFVLLALATHKLSRLITKDSVTSPLRAPFATFEEATGASEVSEKPRGAGLQRALGELVTCPMCVAPWVGGALAFGLLLRPRTTRLVTTTFAAVAVSDFLQQAYAAAKEVNGEK
jgi:hypothetical protein